MSGKDNLDFGTLTKTYHRLINKATRKYKVPGRLEQDDLYNEALIILHNVTKSINPKTKPVDFNKVFKTRLWHVLAQQSRFHRAQKRDYRSSVELTDSIIDSRALFNPYLNVVSMDLLQHVVSSLTCDFDRKVLFEVIAPSKRTVKICTLNVKKGSWKERTKTLAVPIEALAKSLNSTYKKVRNSIGRIRKVVAVVSKRFDLLKGKLNESMGSLRKSIRWQGCLNGLVYNS